jgi:hypothetical protein
MKLCVDRAPIRFYFEHRERIDEWAALRPEADLFAAGLLAEVIEDFPTPSDAEMYTEHKTWNAAVLFRPTWADSGGKPQAGIGIGWGSKPNISRPDTSNGPWWGIWHGETTKDDPLPARLRAGLRDAAEPIQLPAGSTWAWWPLWTQLPPAAEGWYNDLPQWAASIHKIVLQAWDAIAEPIDGILAGGEPAGVVSENWPSL